MRELIAEVILASPSNLQAVTDLIGQYGTSLETVKANDYPLLEQSLREILNDIPY